MLEEFQAISPGDLSLFSIVNHPHEAVDMIREHFAQEKIRLQTSVN